MGDVPRVIVHPLNKVVPVESGSTLLDALREADIQVESICGGKGECGKCRVIISRGEYSVLAVKAEKHLTPEERRLGYHLACKVIPSGDMEITIPVESRIEHPQILLSAGMTIKQISPATGKYVVRVSDSALPFIHPSIRLEGYTGQRPRLSEEMYRMIASSTAPVTATVTCTNGFPELIRVEPGVATGSQYGIALDLGTTTVAGLLVDLTTGKILARESALNRQITYGEEVVTRIAFTDRPGGLAALRTAAVESINTVVRRLISVAGIKGEDVSDACLGGNTVMNHLFAGKDSRYLDMADAVVPRRPIILTAREAGITIYPEAYIYCLPNVSRFLGGDAVGDVVASRMHTEQDISLLIDLGTNGEIIIGNCNWLASVSCASGPAFEGAGITHGMRAMRGAIEHVTIDPATGEAAFTVIENTHPRGICGSGIIDAAAAMFSAGILDFSGSIVEGKPFVRKGTAGPEYLLVPKELTAVGRDIVITQQDIDYFMDSKAALCGAIGVLLKKYRVTVNDIRQLYLAGAFGAFTDISNATKFGILPVFPNAAVHSIGNGSLSGAYAALVSLPVRQEAERIAATMVYIDLLIDPDFIEEYSAALYIPGKRELFPEVHTSRNE
jgi:uncharacterized 2Fe-2S/4Fe-4S cluster protein (DUF4445 family)